MVSINVTCADETRGYVQRSKLVEAAAPFDRAQLEDAA